MTEIGYRPDQAPQGAQERLVFKDPNDRHGREFHIPTSAAVNQVYGDSAEVNEAVSDAYAAVQAERDEAAARTPESGASDSELAAGIGANAQTFALIRPMVEQYGFDFDGQTVAQAEMRRDEWDLAA